MTHYDNKQHQASICLKRFFFGGRLVSGPDVSSLFLSAFLIAAPALGFCIKAILKEDKPAVSCYPVRIVALVLTILDVVFLLTSSRDPGIVPRNMRPPECDDSFEMNTPSMEWVNGRTPHLKLPRTKDVMTSKEKSDIGMGNKFAEGKSSTLPDILLIIEYGGIHDNLKQKVIEREMVADSDNFAVPVDLELEESAASPIVEVVPYEEEKYGVMKSQPNTAPDQTDY
ncbi:hypothetical protein SASPL_114730 [Salvia splendens]|uniref:Uncharacterized protein n=1 Tax=Salvia splendens TaxID=180675 RepID=A0A8X8Y2I3_SALSN|nr:hypothetical protein SASPL_114730 [Salvia splendens]